MTDEPSSGFSDVVERYARRGALAAVIVAVGWHLGYDLPVMVLRWGFYRHPLVVAGCWTGELLIVGLCGRGALRGGIGGRSAVGASATSLAGGLVVVWCCDGAVISLSNWATGSIGWLFVLAFWRQPYRWLVASYAANAVLMGVFVVGAADGATMSRYVQVVYGIGALQLGFAAGIRALRRTLDVARTSYAEVAATRATAHAAEQAHRERSRRRAEINEMAVPLLDVLAAGADPGDRAVQHESALAAARLRRLFIERDDLPDPLLADLRACADAAERCGVVVEMAPAGRSPELALEIRRGLVDPLLPVLTGAVGRARVTLLVEPAKVTVSVVAVSPYQPAPSDRPDIEVDWLEEEGKTWVQTEYTISSE